MIESYHTTRVFAVDEFNFAMDMLDTYSWLSRDHHRRGFDELMDRLVLSSEERLLIESLFEKFVYVDVDYCEQLLSRIVSQIIDVWGCRVLDTVVMTTRAKPKENDGSLVFLKQLQDRLYGWKDRNFINIYEKQRRFPTVKEFHNIILVDDFIGSGYTMSERYETLLREMNSLKSKRNVYVVALAGMSAARNNYPILKSDNVFVPLWLDKAFERYADRRETEVMEQILDRLYYINSDGKRYNLNKYRYGYRDMASLYYNVHYRVPNNVLPIFWWSVLDEEPSEYHSMFRRA